MHLVSLTDAWILGGIFMCTSSTRAPHASLWVALPLQDLVASIIRAMGWLSLLLLLLLLRDDVTRGFAGCGMRASAAQGDDGLVPAPPRDALGQHVPGPLRRQRHGPDVLLQRAHVLLARPLLTTSLSRASSRHAKNTSTWQRPAGWRHRAHASCPACCVLRTDARCSGRSERGRQCRDAMEAAALAGA
jgi:hypothetical protein